MSATIGGSGWGAPHWCGGIGSEDPSKKSPSKPSNPTDEKVSQVAKGALGNGDQSWFDPNNPPTHDCSKLGCHSSS